MDQTTYSVQFSVDYPDRALDRVNTAFRIFAAVPIAVVLGAVNGGVWQSGGGRQSSATVTAAGGLLFLGPLLMILFRQKYPRWWFDWNLELQRFANRVAAYLALMDDQYPSTDDQQSVHLDYAYPDAHELNRWLPLVKWLLALPHYIVLIILDVAALAVVIVSWFAILFTGRYPRGLFTFVEGVIRWHNRVACYAFALHGRRRSVGVRPGHRRLTRDRRHDGWRHYGWRHYGWRRYGRRFDGWRFDRDARWERQPRRLGRQPRRRSEFGWRSGHR